MSNLACVLIYSMTNVFLKMVLKTAVFYKFCKTCMSLPESTVKEVTVLRVTTFLNEVLRQI